MAIRTRITPAVRLPAGAPRLQLATGGVGIVATLYFTRMLALQGFNHKLEGLVGLIVLTVLVIGFIAVPWVMVAWMIPFFAALPTLKVLVSAQLGPLKDLIAFAAIGAAAVLALQRRATRRSSLADGVVLALAGGLFLLYLVDPGGLSGPVAAHGSAWFQGVRLFNEPLALLVVGLTLRHPRRTLTAARTSLILTAAAVALYGVAQQAIGIPRLHQLGFAYDTELRMTAARNQAGATWSYEYDAVGNLIGESDFNGRSFAYRRDHVGQLIGITNPGGDQIDVAQDFTRTHGKVVEVADRCRHDPKFSARLVHRRSCWRRVA